jgi:hypothetical protein
MFIGHFAVGLAAKRVAPRVSLGALFLSVQLIDLLWPLLLLLRLERVRIAPGATAVTPLDFYDYPITHSLMGVIGWSLVLGSACLRISGDRRAACVLGAGVLSHWVLDALVHRPDLLLVPGLGTRIGLGLWDSPAGTVIVELGMFVAGCALYLRSTVALDRAGRYGIWSLIGFLALVYLGNLLGPPPPGEEAIAVAGLAQWLLIPWAWWADRHRKATA